MIGTAQACLFRDSYQELTSLGFAVYGLSRDTLKANQAFKQKLNLPFPLLCNEDGTLLDALGFTQPPDRVLRGVVALDKEGRVLTSIAGSPDATINAVYTVVTAESSAWQRAVENPKEAVNDAEVGSHAKGVSKTIRPVAQVGIAAAVEMVLDEISPWR